MNATMLKTGVLASLPAPVVSDHRWSVGSEAELLSSRCRIVNLIEAQSGRSNDLEVWILAGCRSFQRHAPKPRSTAARPNRQRLTRRRNMRAPRPPRPCRTISSMPAYWPTCLTLSRQENGESQVADDGARHITDLMRTVTSLVCVLRYKSVPSTPISRRYQAEHASIVPES
jgi:hypothetical protein